MSGVGSESALVSSGMQPQIKLWERAFCWLVFVIAIGNAGALGYTVVKNWQVVIEGIREGAIPIWSFGLQILLVAPAVLLLLRNRWCLPLFFAHVVLSFAYIATRYGVASIGPILWLGYMFELLVVAFCVRLIGRGALK
jgi:hypothetical protein